MVAGSWIAVAWHRFILSEEIPSGYIPKFHGRRMMAYFGQILLLGLLIGVLLTGLETILMFQFDNLSETLTDIIFLGLIGSLIGSVFFRFAAILPAAALGDWLGWGGAWRTTKGSTGSLVLVSLVLWGGLMWANEHVTDLISGNLFLLALWTIPFQWIFLMIHVSILTTLYGHYVETCELY